MIKVFRGQRFHRGHVDILHCIFFEQGGAMLIISYQESIHWYRRLMNERTSIDDQAGLAGQPAGI
jgi:hypothetical protein